MTKRAKTCLIQAEPTKNVEEIMVILRSTSWFPRRQHWSTDLSVKTLTSSILSDGCLKSIQPNVLQPKKRCNTHGLQSAFIKIDYEVNQY